ncbi:TonB-dependent siderophore receptor [Sphingobium sp. DEHP117]|uniref:TonB-dependent receptor n=1 Tax=Sphingobium sp. DEHP117 TaxID=2993436 RepID=UPI0027D50576|nr:TonB-dependent siderophore receptor [Sphingobium sp. DEHP117]MDQ4421602.1 TonB-dependent siderophore receptor [Sphingobium sp. DEHP117]
MKFALLLSTALLAFPTMAAAEEAAGDDTNTILVIGKSVGYAATDSVTATKTDTPLIDVPQTISVVTRQQLDDQAQHSIADVLRYIPGTTVGQGEGNRDQITIRGQNSTSDFFLDGVRDDVQYYRSLYNIERVEILKGPYALIFGRGGGGGIINRVQKAPSNERFFASAGGSVNSFGAWDASADVNLPVSAGGALRVNGFYENLANHRDHFDGERYAINPYLAFDLGGGWKAGLSYEYVKDDRVTDRGIPSLACTQPCTPGPLPGHRDTFFGVPGVNRTGLEAHIVKARLDGQLTDNLNWSSTVLYGDYDKYYTNVYANGGATAPSGTVALAGYIDPTKRENFIAQTNLVWDVALGAIENKILLGLEYGEQDSTNQRRNAVLSSSTLNLANIVYPTVTFPAVNRDTASKVKFFSAYAQDQIGIGEHVDLVVGLRFDRFDIKGTDFAVTPDRPFARVDEKVSPRIGLIFKPRENISAYASYSQSFLPRSGDQFLTMTTTQENLAPEKFTNYEIGAKWDIHPGLSATVALFQLDRTNATTPDPLNPATTINAGETRTRGIELALTGRLTDKWQMSGGYTYQDAKLRGNDFVRLGQVPEHQFALWNRYDFNRFVGAGIGVIHQSSQFAANRTTASVTRLPGFTRVDAALFFNASEKVQFQVNVENLLDTTYFADAHNNNNISTGAPLNARLSARIKF